MSEEEATLQICKFCVYKDRIDELDAFHTKDNKTMNEHYQEVHGINLEENKVKFNKVQKNPLKYGLINWKEKKEPLSKQLMFIHGNFAPIQLRVVKRSDNDFIDLLLPSFPIIFEDSDTIEIPTNINDKRYKVTFKIELDEKAEDMPSYLIPRGYHNDCFECPMSFRKSFETLSDIIENTGDMTDYSNDVIRFKCNLNLCDGVLNKHRDKLYILIKIGDDIYAQKVEETNKKSPKKQRKKQRKR